MFYRLALPGARRVLIDHIAFCREHVPRWNPMSVVGQHMQQAGATPAEAMAFTLSTRGAERRGLHRPRHGPGRVPAALHLLLRHLAQLLRGDRQVPRRPAHLGAARARAPRREGRAAWRFKFHAQTSGVDLTRQQPLNNIARVTAQAMAGIFGGLQSLHTDAYDEAFQVPSEAGARIAVATQNILREEAHLTDVIDPLGGSFYVESLTDAMEEKIVAIMKTIDDAGGMYKAVEAGLVQRMIGASAMRFQQRVEAGEQIDRRRQQVPGRRRGGATGRRSSAPTPRRCRRHLDDFVAAKAERSRGGRERRARRPHPRSRGKRRQRLRRRGRRRPRRPDATRRSARGCAATSASASRSSSSDVTASTTAPRRSPTAPLAGDRRALARLLTLIDDDAAGRTRGRGALAARAGRAWIVGVTGVPGSGKSTLVDALLGAWLAQGHRSR